MGTLAVTIDGVNTFTWTGEKADIDRIEATFREGAARLQRTPEILAEDMIGGAMAQAQDGVPIQPEAQPWLLLAITYVVLSLAAGHPRRPGKIRDYLPGFDFDVDLHYTGAGRFKTLVSAVRHRFDA